MKILFIGGTGRLSKDVATLALLKGHEVYLFTRGSKERKQFVNTEYHMLNGDIRDLNFCQKLMLNQPVFDVIIDFLSYNLSQLKNTLDIIAGHFQQFIFISSATVYKECYTDERISECDTPIGNDKWTYAYDKYLCEEFIKTYFNFYEKEGKYTVVRPYVTYGNTRVPYPLVPRDNSKEWTYIDRILNNQSVPVFNQGETVTTLTHTRDFAKGVVGLFKNTKAYGETFHITNSETTTWGEVLDVIGKSVEHPVLKKEFTQEEIFSIMPEYKSVLLGDKGREMRFNTDKICQAVPDFKCEISLEDGLAEMVNFYQEHQEHQRIDYIWNGCVDRLLLKKKVKNKRQYPFSNAKDRICYYIGRYSLLVIIYKILKRIKRYTF